MLRCKKNHKRRNQNKKKRLLKLNLLRRLNLKLLSQLPNQQEVGLPGEKRNLKKYSLSSRKKRLRRKRKKRSRFLKVKLALKSLNQDPNPRPNQQKLKERA